MQRGFKKAEIWKAEIWEAEISKAEIWKADRPQCYWTGSSI